MNRRDFLGTLAKTAAYFGVQYSPAQNELAVKAVETIAKISKLTHPEVNNAMHAMDALADAMSGKTVRPYAHLIKRVELALASETMSTAEFTRIMNEFNIALPTLKSMNPDILLSYEQYLGDRSFAEIFSDPNMKEIADSYMQVRFKAFENVKAASEETLKVLNMPASERGAYLDSCTNLTKLQEKAENLAKEIAKTNAPSRVTVENSRVQCSVWPKVQLKDYGYNMKLHRLKNGRGKFAPEETHSAWEKRTKAFAEDIKKAFPDVRIEHETFHQGRIVVLVEKGSKADEYFRDYNKSRTPQTGAISFGR